MPVQLNVPYPEKDHAKALGARWNPIARYWEVPDGLLLEPFQKWLLTNQAVLSHTASPVANQTHTQGLSLSQLLGQVTETIEKRFPEEEWVRAEVTEMSSKGGHVYLNLAEQNAAGQVVARARAIIWDNIAQALLPRFKQATQAELVPGIKLLVYVRVKFQPAHGLSLQILDIDPAYTLGDMAAKIAEIRQRLISEGLINRQKLLPKPTDFFNVLVISPASAAGLGDFRREADTFSDYGVCQFSYQEAYFQGERAAIDIVKILESGVIAHEPRFDAVVIIRGGGAITDLHWLNDYAIARAICRCPIPVITGIGHERDNTILDEVAAIRCDTPSKVIAFIGLQIHNTAQQSSVILEKIQHRCRELLSKYDTAIEKSYRSLYLGVMYTKTAWQENIAAYQTRILATVPQKISQIRRDIAQLQQMTYREAVIIIKEFNQHCQQIITLTSELSFIKVRQIKERIEGCYRETVAQGPQRTLARGFIIARNEQGHPISTASAALSMHTVILEFRDGLVQAGLFKPMNQQIE